MGRGAVTDAVCRLCGGALRALGGVRWACLGCGERYVETAILGIFANPVLVVERHCAATRRESADA